ncbi:unnamed protein product [Ixodes pacificus]
MTKTEGEGRGGGNASAARSSCACVCMHLPVSEQRERLFLVALFILFFFRRPFSSALLRAGGRSVTARATGSRRDIRGDLGGVVAWARAPVWATSPLPPFTLSVRPRGRRLGLAHRPPAQRSSGAHASPRSRTSRWPACPAVASSPGEELRECCVRASLFLFLFCPF